MGFISFGVPLTKAHSHVKSPNNLSVNKDTRDGASEWSLEESKRKPLHPKNNEALPTFDPGHTYTTHTTHSSITFESIDYTK